MSSDDLSPFMNLNRDVQLAILKQLRFRDYRNLALTCRKWFESASTAPNSMKPIVKVDNIVVKFYSFHAEKCSRVINIYGEEDYRRSQFKLNIHMKFQLVNQIKCSTLDVENGFKRRGYDPVVKYLIDNKDKFCFEHLNWTVQPDGMSNKELIGRLFDLSRNQLTISVPEYEFDEEFNLRKKENIRELIEEDRKFETINCRIKMPVELFKTVLKQVVNGDRPNMIKFDYQYNYEDSEDWLKDFIENELPVKLTSEKVDRSASRENVYYYLTTSDERKLCVRHDSSNQDDICNVSFYYPYC